MVSISYQLLVNGIVPGLREFTNSKLEEGQKECKPEKCISKCISAEFQRDCVNREWVSCLEHALQRYKCTGRYMSNENAHMCLMLNTEYINL